MSTLNRNFGIPHFEAPQSRREMLLKSGAGFGALALSALLGESAYADASTPTRGPHFAPTAKRAIFLFMEGGPSHIDLFDPKPLLNELAGQPIPDSFIAGKNLITPMGELHSPLLEAPRTWKQHGEAGTWVSEWLPQTAKFVDDIAVVRSCWTNGINHAGGVCQMNTGTPLAGRPSLGSWVNYGLGTENADLPAFVVLKDLSSQIVNGPRNWGTGFMPAVYQGTMFEDGPVPIPNLYRPKSIDEQRQLAKLGLLNQFNESHAQERAFQTELDARIKAYELAFRMQATAPEAVDLSQETQQTLDLYGVNDKLTGKMGRNCLLARRLAERGVRFIQVYHGAGSKWDSHSSIEKNHSYLCKQMDQPVAALLADLKQRGLLEDTLVIWGGEFGRTPMSEQGNGRDHNATGFTMWFAGGGVKGGQTIGETDELGLYAIRERMHVHDLHATILSLMGLGHMELTYQYKGRPERPTQNEGRVLTKLVTG